MHSVFRKAEELFRWLMLSSEAVVKLLWVLVLVEVKGSGGTVNV